MSLKEDRIPKDKMGRPDLSRYTDPVQYYVAMYQRYLEAMHGSSGSRYDAQLEFRRRVHATWGLIAKGAEAVPHAVAMLRSEDADAREDGAGILAEVGKDGRVIEHVLRALASETDATARDSLVLALGAFKNRAAIPILADLIRDDATDGDTRWTAVGSLGRIVRRRFLDQAQPVQAALEWLNKHENGNA
jgi:HEAT repeat protein